ncbi:MAG: peptidyl-prolyl cis-trans isomerase [Deltaproteobacteria bacterium]|nr:peptidyl-prolyl cis-trans isomerase [Deltaproteobacteria bacterium]
MINFSKLIFWGLLLALVGAAGMVQAEMANRIVAVVNNEIITWMDLEGALKGLPPGMDFRNPEVQKQVLFQLIDQKLLEIQSKKLGLQVGKEEVTAALTRIRQDQGLGRDEDFAAALTRQGISEEDLRRRIHDQILRFRLVSREVGSKIIFSEERIRDYYQKNVEKFGGVERIHLAQIVITASEAPDREAARARIEALKARLDQGEDFKQLAKTAAQDPAGAQSGELGVFEINEIDPSLKETVVSLKPGQVSPVQPIEQGWRIVKLLEREKTERLTLEQAREKIQEQLYQEEMEARYGQWLQKLRERSSIQILL